MKKLYELLPHIEDLSAEDAFMAKDFLEKAQRYHEEWFDLIEKLFPIRAKVRCLVKFIDTENGNNSTGLDKFVRKIKYAFNIGHIKDKVKEANAEYMRLKRDNKSLYQAEEKAKEELLSTLYTVACITYQGDTFRANMFEQECEEELKDFTETTIKEIMEKMNT